MKKFIPPVYFYSPGHIRDVERFGLRYAVDISRLLDHSIFYYNVSEPAWTNLFSLLKKDFNVIDAGANIGYVTLQVAARCSEGSVYSFEPDSDNYKSLVRNISLNSFGNIRTFRKALGKERGTATLYKLYKNNPGANRILSSAPPTPVEKETVEVCTLDEMNALEHFKKIDLIKVDVEGFELFVLQGAQRLILRDKPLLFVEMAAENLIAQGYSPKELVDFIGTMDYRVMDALTMRELDLGNLRHTDIICIHRQHE